MRLYVSAYRLAFSHLPWVSIGLVLIFAYFTYDGLSFRRALDLKFQAMGKGTAEVRPATDAPETVQASYAPSRSCCVEVSAVAHRSGGAVPPPAKQTPAKQTPAKQTPASALKARMQQPAATPVLPPMQARSPRAAFTPYGGAVPQLPAFASVHASPPAAPPQWCGTARSGLQSCW